MLGLISKFAWKATQHIGFLVESFHSELLGGMVHWALMSALQQGAEVRALEFSLGETSLLLMTQK